MVAVVQYKLYIRKTNAHFSAHHGAGFKHERGNTVRPCISQNSTGCRAPLAPLPRNLLLAKLYRPGSVGYTTKSGGMSNELNNIVSLNTDGVREGGRPPWAALDAPCGSGRYLSPMQQVNDQASRVTFWYLVCMNTTGTDHNKIGYATNHWWALFLISWWINWVKHCDSSCRPTAWVKHGHLIIPSEWPFIIIIIMLPTSNHHDSWWLGYTIDFNLYDHVSNSAMAWIIGSKQAWKLPIGYI